MICLGRSSIGLDSLPSFRAAVYAPVRRRSGVSSYYCEASEKASSYTTLAEPCRKQIEVKKSKFIAWAAPIVSERAALSFLSEVSDARATHNCWAYKIQNAYRFNDDGEPSGTAGKPIYSSIVASGLDGVMVVVTRYFGGIKLGTGGLVRAYGGVVLDCLKEAKTLVFKPKSICCCCCCFEYHWNKGGDGSSLAVPFFRSYISIDECLWS
ncbi:hypothetical protein KP509_34G023600 [Ceratopteris richardii]|uniref:Impact N-terminal domain-containing protein n=1 Tax=Ceratopteris richardii TaxID=49495 RepID=A0A8T2QJF5_CERRI|nr:hypothetical protein KP509_34G023600 [Ceratopteris richardii]